MVRELKGKAVISGSAEGKALVSKEPLSFWGGVDPQTGEITDRRHDRSGANISGKVFVFPHGKGSSTSSAVLLESIRNTVAPIAMINVKVEPILALGAILAEEMYQRTIPIIVLTEDDFIQIQEGDDLLIQPDGTIYIQTSGAG